MNVFDQLLGIETCVEIEWFQTRDRLVETFGEMCKTSGLLLAFEHDYGMKFGWLKNPWELCEMMFIYPSMERCLYEIVPPERPHKIYFDLDWKKCDSHGNRLEQSQVEEWVERMKKGLPLLFEEYYGKEWKGAKWYEATTGEKYSFHVIVQGYWSPNHVETKAFAEFCTKLDIPIDMAVYKPWQSFRVPYGIKRTTMTPLVPMEKTTMEEDIMKGLLTFGDGILLERKFEKPVIKGKITSGDFQETNDEEVMDFIAKQNLLIIKREGPIIVLKNQGGFYCRKCKEIHHKVHPYIMETPQAFFFSCRQAPMIELKRKNLMMDVSFD